MLLLTSSHRKCSFKIDVLKISQNSQENTSVKVLLSVVPCNYNGNYNQSIIVPWSVRALVCVCVCVCVCVRDYFFSPKGPVITEQSNKCNVTAQVSDVVLRK